MAEVLLVDDSGFMRSTLRDILEREHEVAAEAANGVEAVGRFEAADSDLITMDVTMPGKDAIQATADSKATDTGAKIVMCTSGGQPDVLDEISSVSD